MDTAKLFGVNDVTGREFLAQVEAKAIRENDLKEFIKVRMVGNSFADGLERTVIDRAKTAIEAAEQVGIARENPEAVLRAVFEVLAGCGIALSIALLKDGLKSEAVVDSLMATGALQAEASAFVVSNSIVGVLAAEESGKDMTALMGEYNDAAKKASAGSN